MCYSIASADVHLNSLSRLPIVMLICQTHEAFVIGSPHGHCSWSLAVERTMRPPISVASVSSHRTIYPPLCWHVSSNNSPWRSCEDEDRSPALRPLKMITAHLCACDCRNHLSTCVLCFRGPKSDRGGDCFISRAVLSWQSGAA